MFESGIDPKALLSILRERHVHYISRIEATILAHLSLGYRTEEIAQRLGCTGATVRRHVADLTHRVFDPTEIEGDRNKLRTWVPLHSACCAMAVAQLIEDEQQFG